MRRRAREAIRLSQQRTSRVTNGGQTRISGGDARLFVLRMMACVCGTLGVGVHTSLSARVNGLRAGL